MTVTALLTMAWSPFEIRNCHAAENAPPPAAPAHHRPKPGQTSSRSGDSAEETRPQALQAPDASARQRMSFFGRSSSIARRRSHIRTTQAIPSNQQDQNFTPTLHTSQTVRPIRPSAEGQRSTIDPLERVRKSIFRRKVDLSSDGQVHILRPSSSPSQVCKSSRGRHVSDAPATSDQLPTAAKDVAAPREEQRKLPEERFYSEKAYDHHRKKSSISFPFNFQHVTHTVSKHRPKLDTVDERDLPAKFWAFNTSERPKQRLDSIKAEDLGVHRSISPSEVVAQPPTTRVFPRPLHRTRSLIAYNITRKVDDMTFDETSETKFNPHEVLRSLDDVDTSSATLLRSTLSKHYMSVSALGSATQSQQLQDQYSASGGLPLRGLPHIVSQAARAGMPPLLAATADTIPDDLEGSRHVGSPLPGQSTKATEPLPPLPRPDDTKRDSLNSVLSYSLFPMPRSCKGNSAASTTSERSLGSTAPTSARSFHEAKTDVLNELTWEDDIEFAYAQAAEGSCDFDWAVASSPLTDEKVKGLSANGNGDHCSSIDEGVSCSPDLSSPVKSTSPMHGEPSSVGAGSPVAEFVQREYGASTGHKSLTAARGVSQDGVSKSPASFTSNGSCGGVGAQSPDYHLTSTQVDRPPRVLAKSQSLALNLVINHLNKPASSRTTSRDDGESLSAGSYRSNARSVQTTSDTSQWSPASTSSIQNSPVSERTGRSQIRRNATTTPLETIPRSSNDFNPSLMVPQSPPLPLGVQSETETVIMRRPETPGDREVLFTTGRMVQRGRSATPNRHAIRADAVRNGGWI